MGFEDVVARLEEVRELLRVLLVVAQTAGVALLVAVGVWVVRSVVQG